jgi:type IV pilus assembly protein PilQ
MNSLVKMRLGGFFLQVLVLISLLFPLVCIAQEELAKNKLSSISYTGTSGLPVVQIYTELPVGYRYTVYDSYDPIRVVIDLPGLDVSSIIDSIKVGNGPLQEIRVESFNLASGQLGRVELILTNEAQYKVSSEANLFSITFIEKEADISSTVESQKTIESKPVEMVSAKPESVATSLSDKISAKSIKAVRIDSGKLSIDMDGDFENFQYFHLRSPLRLVVDIYGVKPEFSQRIYNISDQFRQVRVGDSDKKTRFVLDVSGNDFPNHKVVKEGNVLIISWNGGKPVASGSEKTTVLEAKMGSTTKKKLSPSSGRKKSNSSPDKKNTTTIVDGVDFKVENGNSILTISLSGPAEITSPVSEKDLVRFGIKNVTISRSLRRSIDASSFPSAIKRIIPYIVEGGNEIRFISELKGAAPYSIKQENGKVIFIVENMGFAEPAPTDEKVMVAVPKLTPVSELIVPTVAATLSDVNLIAAEATVHAVNVVAEKKLDIERKNEFTGEKISLVFDDANIRNILQLIGEVSNLNIIAGEDVKGIITLRLIDVPWDQALSLILDSKNLGMLREGNVVRIMPKEQIRSLRQAEMTAVKEERQLEQVVTEIIPVNYTALGNITTPAKELLTDRGKITEDTRNKQIIVTDIPSSIEGIKKLAAILDTPERQVMIEARIVEASSSFGRDLGVKWGISYDNNPTGPADIDTANVGLGGSFLIAPPAAGSVMGNAGLGSGITFGRLGIDSTVLDLRISALESGGYGKVISTPRVSTLNGGSATISQGTKIPYQSAGDDGKAKTEFVDANLSLTVQAVINPDDSIILDINATNSSIGSTVSTGAGSAPAIDTKEAKTKVIVRNGETTVIGGIFVESENNSHAGVPLLMHIPIIGHLFRSDSTTNNRSEMLVFITPRIVQ